jgi:hypothetical protein
VDLSECLKDALDLGLVEIRLSTLNPPPNLAESQFFDYLLVAQVLDGLDVGPDFFKIAQCLEEKRERAREEARMKGNEEARGDGMDQG